MGRRCQSRSQHVPRIARRDDAVVPQARRGIEGARLARILFENRRLECGFFIRVPRRAVFFQRVTLHLRQHVRRLIADVGGYAIGAARPQHRRSPLKLVGRKTEISNLLANLPRLGAGLAYREPFRDELLQKQSEVDFVEIIGDHYLDAPPERMDELALLGQHFTLVPHFTNLSLGSADGLDPVYLEKASALIRRLSPPWWSEHIGFVHAGGIRLDHPAPLPFTREAVEELKLRRGDDAIAIIKATEVMLAREMSAGNVG